jgi:hypothetical protein
LAVGFAIIHRPSGWRGRGWGYQPGLGIAAGLAAAPYYYGGGYSYYGSGYPYSYYGRYYDDCD